MTGTVRGRLNQIVSTELNRYMQSHKPMAHGRRQTIETD